MSLGKQSETLRIPDLAYQIRVTICGAAGPSRTVAMGEPGDERELLRSKSGADLEFGQIIEDFILAN